VGSVQGDQNYCLQPRMEKKKRDRHKKLRKDGKGGEKQEKKLDLAYRYRTTRDKKMGADMPKTLSVSKKRGANRAVAPANITVK